MWQFSLTKEIHQTNLNNLFRKRLAKRQERRAAAGLAFKSMITAKSMRYERNSPHSWRRWNGMLSFNIIYGRISKVQTSINQGRDALRDTIQLSSCRVQYIWTMKSMNNQTNSSKDPTPEIIPTRFCKRLTTEQRIQTGALQKIRQHWYWIQNNSNINWSTIK